jgi:hypothetical protein
LVAVPQQPKPLMSRNQGVLEAALPASLAPRSLIHELQYVQQVLRDLDVSLVACMMEGDEDLVGQAPLVVGLWIGVLGG